MHYHSVPSHYIELIAGTPLCAPDVNAIKSKNNITKDTGAQSGAPTIRNIYSWSEIWLIKKATTADNYTGLRNSKKHKKTVAHLTIKQLIGR